MARTPMDTVIFSAIVFILLFVTTTAQVSGSGGAKPKATDLMIEVCKNATLNNAYADPVKEEFCLTTLQSDNRSAKAKDLRDLLQVTVDILRGLSHYYQQEGQENVGKHQEGHGANARPQFV